MALVNVHPPLDPAPVREPGRHAERFSVRLSGSPVRTLAWWEEEDVPC